VDLATVAPITASSAHIALLFTAGLTFATVAALGCAARALRPALYPLSLTTLGSIVDRVFATFPQALARGAATVIVVTLSPRGTPTGAVTIPSSTSVVTVPVAVDGESDNRHADPRTIFDDRLAPAVM
jgi:hypothetical protein